jgi:hypothetical protein
MMLLSMLAGCTWISADAHMDRLEEYAEKWREDTGDDDDDDSGGWRDTGDGYLSSGEDGIGVESVVFAAGGGAVRWTVLAEGDLRWVNLAMIETADPGFEDGCESRPTSMGVICGAWAEYHDDFSCSGNEAEISLEVVHDVGDAASNQGTLFDVEILEDDRVTWLVAVGGDGGVQACRAGGHRPSYFSPWC